MGKMADRRGRGTPLKASFPSTPCLAEDQKFGPEKCLALSTRERKTWAILSSFLPSLNSVFLLACQDNVFDYGSGILNDTEAMQYVWGTGACVFPSPHPPSSSSYSSALALI